MADVYRLLGHKELAQECTDRAGNCENTIWYNNNVISIRA